MLSKPESACFVIADISGYTSFLHGAELDHAQDIIADIMDTVLRPLRAVRSGGNMGRAAVAGHETDHGFGVSFADASPN
jgi:hypothetical protein